MRNKLLLIALAFSFVSANAQDFAERKNKGRIYASYGLNRTSYDLSTLKMKGSSYDFSLIHFDAVDGHDGLDFSKFSGKLGFFLTENLSISVGYDNFSYATTNNRLVKIGGTIDTGDYAATYYHQADVIRTKEEFLTYNYTKLNYINLNLEVNDDFWVSKNGKFAWSYYFGLGGGILMTESQVALMGGAAVTTSNGMSGFGGNASFGTRFHLGPVFLEVGGKAGYMRTKEVKMPRNGMADHTFLFASGIGSVGLSFKF